MTCDRCRARAKWRFRHPDNPLLELTFCGHHGGAFDRQEWEARELVQA